VLTHGGEYDCDDFGNWESSDDVVDSCQHDAIDAAEVRGLMRVISMKPGLMFHLPQWRGRGLKRSMWPTCTVTLAWRPSRRCLLRVGDVLGQRLSIRAGNVAVHALLATAG